MRKRSTYVIIIGPDGSGKTTLANELADALADKYSVRRINFTFGIMPSISRILGRTESRAAPEGQPNSGMVTPLRRSRAIILAIWYGLDHIMGHWVLLRKGKGDVVIFARAYHDFLYQRAYLNLPEAIPRLFLMLGPKPDLVASPLRSPQAIHAQKPELSVEEIEEQYARILDRFMRFCYFRGIDASQGITLTVQGIRSLLKL